MSTPREFGTPADLPHGSRRCMCSRCSRLFSSVSAFVKHKPGACLEPGSVGLVPVPKKDVQVWSFPAPDSSPWQAA